LIQIIYYSNITRYAAGQRSIDESLFLKHFTFIPYYKTQTGLSLKVILLFGCCKRCFFHAPDTL